MPTLQRRHYELIAAALTRVAPSSGRTATIVALCHAFHADNPRFSPERFRAACDGADHGLRLTNRPAPHLQPSQWEA